jgi:myo-inositol 2-dehydrogenase/D-chiro-inositol 1-dehydrogenase
LAEEQPMVKSIHQQKPDDRSLSRRDFLKEAGAAALTLTVLSPGLVRGAQANSRIKLGIIGCGGRGTWIAGLFANHGGYEIFAGADYFADRASDLGAKFSIPEPRLFTGLSAYKRLLECGVEAVAVESPPYFHPEQAAAAVARGVHVYLAKPIAVDAPGCRLIAEAARRATQKGLCFLVDFQTRSNEFYREAVERVHNGAIGDFVFGEATYHADCPFEKWYDPVRDAPADSEVRLRAWGLDRSLSGDIITEQEIHVLDVASWIMNAPPLFAVGSGGLTARPKIGTCFDHFVVYYQYPSDVAVQFSGRQFKGYGTAEGLKNRMFGSKGVLETEYGGNVLIRGDNFYRGGKTTQIYEEGAVNNIAAFHRSITGDDFENATIEPSVRSNLVTILGRKAAYEKRRVTWDEVVNDDERLSPDLSGLKE